MLKGFVHLSHVNQEVLEPTREFFFPLNSWRSVYVCVCVCLCVRETARHTSVVAINLTLDSPFEHTHTHANTPNTHTHTHTHYQCLNQSCHPVSVSSPLLSRPTCHSKTVFLFSPLSSFLPLVLLCPLPSSLQSCPLLSSLFSSFSLFSFSLTSTVLHPQPLF